MTPLSTVEGSASNSPGAYHPLGGDAAPGRVVAGQQQEYLIVDLVRGPITIGPSVPRHSAHCRGFEADKPAPAGTILNRAGPWRPW